MDALNNRIKKTNNVALVLVVVTIILVLLPVPEDLSLGFVIVTVACATYLLGLVTARQFVQGEDGDKPKKEE